MADIHGSQLVLMYNSVNISPYVKDDIELSAGTRDLHDKTGFGSTDTSHSTSPIKEGVPINIGGQLSDASHTQFAVMDGSDYALEARPAGTGSGKQKLAGTATLTDYKTKHPVRGPGTWSAVLTPNNGLAWGTQP